MSMSMNDRSAVASLSPSAVSWSAVLAGAVAAAAFALVLLTLGAGLGLATISPWGNNSVSASTLGVLAVAWLLAIHLFAFGLGGYLAGRLRTRWLSTHGDEVYFRDTAHGLLVWCVGTIVSACLAASVLSGAASTVGSTAATAGNAAANNASYFTDALFRSDRDTANADSSRVEVGRLFTRALTSDLSSADRTYATQVIARQTGISPAEAEQRLTQGITQAKAAAETARKVALYSALWIFIAMLLGAFSASYMATVGGEARDDVD